MKARSLKSSITSQVVALGKMPMDQLWILWDRFFVRRPSHHNRGYIQSRVAYKLQEEAFGTTLPSRLHLLRIGETQSTIKTRHTNHVRIMPGTVLVREHDNREHRVTALPDGGFDYEGRRFKSLSAVARHVTGCQWSGPAFFGLLKSEARAK